MHMGADGSVAARQTASTTFEDSGAICFPGRARGRDQEF
jgi:hypothetical protein